jgi:hypothetical protein
MTNHKEFENWCNATGHDYCFDVNQSGEYQWADAQGAYEAFCYGLSQQRTWVGLTNDECVEIAARGYPRWLEFAQAVEAKLKEKNSGP